MQGIVIKGANIQVLTCTGWMAAVDLAGTPGAAGPTPRVPAPRTACSTRADRLDRRAGHAVLAVADLGYEVENIRPTCRISGWRQVSRFRRDLINKNCETRALYLCDCFPVLLSSSSAQPWVSRASTEFTTSIIFRSRRDGSLYGGSPTS